MKVYQAADGQWIIFNNGLKTYFSTQAEALAVASKIEFTQSTQSFSTRLAELFLEAPDLEAIYFDRGYNSGGANPIIDADIASEGVTAAQVASFITLAQQLKNFADNAAVTTGDYSATVNALRTDK